MKIEKDGIVKELEDEFMLADYLQAGWRKVKAEAKAEVKPFKTLGHKKEVK